MLLSSAYLPPVWYFSKLVSCDGREVRIEQYDHYLKQTYRNRCNIVGSLGVQSLTIPVEKGDDAKTLMRDVRVSEHGNWRHLHWNALSSAYSGTPFFLYFEDDFRKFYEHPVRFLFDFNLQLTELLCRLAGIQPLLKPTDSFQPVGTPEEGDFREVIHPKRDYNLDASFRPVPYYQVFGKKHGFVPNLSMVDLLFNMGPESILVLHESSC